MVSFNRLLLVIKQTAFDAYKAQEAIATAAGQAVFDPARMQSLARRHDTHMYQVDTLVPIRPRSRGERRSLRTFAVVSLSAQGPSLSIQTHLDAFQLRF